MDKVKLYKCKKCGYTHLRVEKCPICGGNDWEDVVVAEIRTTSCQRTACKQYNTCNVTLKNFTKPDGCEGYMSKTMAIYTNYEQKEKAAGRVPMPYNAYFEW